MFVLAMALAGAAAACTHDPPPAPVDPATLPPLPRSSLAAVILRRAELNLDDDQVRELERLDRERESQDAAVRAELARKSKPPDTGGSSNGSSAAGGSNGSTANAPTGAGMGAGRRGGGMRGGRMGGGRGMRATSAAGPSEADRSARLEDRLDEDDTKAYLDGEELLTAPQRDQAREIASDYRAQLYDRRALLKRQGPAAGK